MQYQFTSQIMIKKTLIIKIDLDLTKFWEFKLVWIFTREKIKKKI